MAQFKGVLKRNDLSGGFWELHAEDGKRYQLSGADAEAMKEGATVEIDGKVDKAAMGIGMTGPILAVKSLKVVEEEDEEE
jgi:hypothetical protein